MGNSMVCLQIWRSIETIHLLFLIHLTYIDIGYIFPILYHLALIYAPDWDIKRRPTNHKKAPFGSFLGLVLYPKMRIRLGPRSPCERSGPLFEGSHPYQNPLH